MILANSTLAQSYLGQGYQTQDTGIDYTVPAPPASSTAWEQDRRTDNATWTELDYADSP
jgi:hypothetical protein